MQSDLPDTVFALQKHRKERPPTDARHLRNRFDQREQREEE